MVRRWALGLLVVIAEVTGLSGVTGGYCGYQVLLVVIAVITGYWWLSWVTNGYSSPFPTIGNSR